MWDLPVRLFHWLLVVLLAVSWISAEIGGNAMEIHKASGFTVLTLVLFRLLWGVFGGSHARFSSFVRGPRQVIRYARSLRGRPLFYAGHNPLGAWMVLALLASLLVQTGSGLFANDDIMTEGPLAKHVSNAASDWFSAVHETNFLVLVTLIAIHVGAAVYYWLAKGENLIWPLVTGWKRVPENVPHLSSRGGRLWLGALLLLACAALVRFLATR